MGYLEIVAIVFGCIWLLFSLLTIHYVIFSIIGLFAVKHYPKTDKKLRYGIIISARNEENVIGALLDSIKNNDYPQANLQVFVVAHNCDDRTAEISREHGATVYEYNNPAERVLGYAYRYLFDRIKEDYGIEYFDGFFVINADNILPEDYISKMNDVFVAYDGKYAVTSYRNSSNFGNNYMSCLYGIYFLAACRFEARGRTICGCSTRVSGTGYVFPSEYVNDGWEYVTMTEDWEFTADQLSQGRKVMYCDDAEFFDEQPTTVKVMWRQRLRWARGHTIVFFTRFAKLIKGIFTRKKRGGQDNKFSQYDIAISIMPLGAMGVALMIIQLICVALSPLFGYDPAVIWSYYGIFSAVGFAFSYLVTFLGGLILMLVERKRIPHVGVFRRIVALLLWPFFLLLNVILDVISLFVKNLEWKTIPHVGQKK